MSNVISEFSGKYRFLSNFFMVPVTYEGIRYPSTEHAYQAAKTHNIDDRITISNMTSPGQAKRAGKKLKLRSDWEEVKIDVMEDILRLKFVKGSHMANLLLTTHFLTLEEGNTWGDRIWGISPPKSGNGENNLGKLLMKIRAEIRKETLND